MTLVNTEDYVQHLCKLIPENNEPFIFKMKNETQWQLCTEDSSGSGLDDTCTPISFCPFCGEKLIE